MASSSHPATTEPLLRVRDVAALLDMSTRSVERLIASGELPRVRISGSVRFRSEDVRDLVERSRHEAAPMNTLSGTPHGSPPTSDAFREAEPVREE